MGRIDIKQQLAESITHGLGVLLAIVAVPVLVSLAVKGGNWVNVWSCSIYGITLLMVYSSSTLYHSLEHTSVGRVFRIIDHVSIYFLIAGSYTPLIFLFINDWYGWVLLAGLWMAALLGTVFKIFFVHRFRLASTLLYLLLGWSAILFIKPIIANAPTYSLLFLFATGFFYTVGSVFYLWERIPYNHTIWHLWVLAGSASHYMALIVAL